MNYTVDDIVALAREAAKEDPIDWGGLNLDSDKVYQMMASQVLEIYGYASQTEDREAVLLATITHLILENFILNLKSQGI